ncbi:hypothetical protein B0T13DRAFT_500969 [Neurospora crassa]|nr:hypothetical protein B0T13DRAFT_500969 [Neurospora crassa]
MEFRSVQHQLYVTFLDCWTYKDPNPGAPPCAKQESEPHTCKSLQSRADWSLPGENKTHSGAGWPMFPGGLSGWWCIHQQLTPTRTAWAMVSARRQKTSAREGSEGYGTVEIGVKIPTTGPDANDDSDEPQRASDTAAP